MLLVSGVVGTGAALVVSVGVVGYAPVVVSVGVVGTGAALVVSVGAAGAIPVSAGCAVVVVSNLPAVASLAPAVGSPYAGAAPASSSPRLSQAASDAAAASIQSIFFMMYTP